VWFQQEKLGLRDFVKWAGFAVEAMRCKPRKEKEKTRKSEAPSESRSGPDKENEKVCVCVYAV
jgi:hypothetical protein